MGEVLLAAWEERRKEEATKRERKLWEGLKTLGKTMLFAVRSVGKQLPVCEWSKCSKDKVGDSPPQCLRSRRREPQPAHALQKEDLGRAV